MKVDETERDSQLPRSHTNHRNESPESNSATSTTVRRVAASSLSESMSLMNDLKIRRAKPASATSAKGTTMNRHTVVVGLRTTATWASARAQPVGEQWDESKLKEIGRAHV